MADRVRVGAVSYLNARPLYYRLEKHAPKAELILDYPSRLADMLARGELDVALIPSVEYLRGAPRGYRIVPGLAIAAKGPVRSVKLFSRVPFREIRRLALDDGSRTSQALCRAWLDERHGVRPEIIEPLPMGVPAEESTADAVLLIGDRAMRDPAGSFVEKVDMAQAWQEMTGLPFVFAVWAVRPGIDLGDLPQALNACRRDGLAHADAIAREHGARLGLGYDECFDYLTKVLSYDLGAPEMAGLRQFARRAAALGLAPEGVELVFLDRHDLATRR